MIDIIHSIPILIFNSGKFIMCPQHYKDFVHMRKNIVQNFSDIYFNFQFSFIFLVYTL